LLEVVKKALDIRVDEKLKAQTTPTPVVDTPMTDKEKEEYEDRIIQGTKKTTPKEEEKPSSDIIEIVDGDSYMSEVETETDDVLYQEDEMVDPDDAILEVESNEESDDIAEAILKDDNQEDDNLQEDNQEPEELESDLENNKDEENTEDLDNLDKQDNLEEQDNFLEVESEEISSDEEQKEGNEAPEEN